jgi:hypothetical protein
MPSWFVGALRRAEKVVHAVVLRLWGGLQRRFGNGPPPTRTDVPTENMIHRIKARDVRRLTGEFEHDPSKSTVRLGDVAGTDLGHMFDMDGWLYMVFGDTYGAGSELPPPDADDPPRRLCNWRSNTMAVIPDSSDISLSGLGKAFMITEPGHPEPIVPGCPRPGGYAKELIPREPHENEVIKIPTSGVEVNRRLFLHYMSIARWVKPGHWNTNYSALAYSDAKGETWSHPYHISSEGMPFVTGVVWPGHSNFAQVGFVKDGGYVYIFGTPARRHGGVKLARVPADRDSLLRPTEYRYFKREGHQWIASEADATIIVPEHVGELSVMYNDYLGRWIMMYTHIPTSSDREPAGTPSSYASRTGL